jgi:hypothetical protein
LKAGALIVAHDPPREISRIAIKWNKSAKARRGFSFYFRMFRDPRTGKIRPSGYEPGISIESLDAAKAIDRPIKYKFHDRDAEQEEEDKKFSNVHILDLKTLTSVLTGEVYSFQSACEIFGAPASRQRKPYSRVTKPALERLLKDVSAELELLNRLNREFERHPVDLPPDRCYSPATLAKSYLSEMGIRPPQEKFKLPERINGIAAQASAGGRAECMIRQTPLPVTYVDFHAQFPSVSKLLDCREISRAESLEFPDFTAGARRMVERVELEDCFRGLVPAKLYSQMRVDPRRDDLAVKLVELRSSLKPKSPELAGGLKVAANSAAFEARLPVTCMGLDAGLGVLHTDTTARDSLACDVMEPVRPQIDSYVLDLITREYLSRSWFYEQPDGNCRLMSKLASRLAETAPTWRRAVAPVAEWVAREFWKTIRRPDTPFTTRLTHENKRTVKGAVSLEGTQAPTPQNRS